MMHEIIFDSNGMKIKKKNNQKSLETKSMIK